MALIGAAFSGGSFWFAWRQNVAGRRSRVVALAEKLDSESFKDIWEDWQRETSYPGSVNGEDWEQHALQVYSTVHTLLPLVDARAKKRAFSLAISQIAVSSFAGYDFANTIFKEVTGAFEFFDALALIAVALLPHMVLRPESYMEDCEVEFFKTADKLSDWFYGRWVKDRVVEVNKIMNHILDEKVDLEA